MKPNVLNKSMIALLAAGFMISGFGVTAATAAKRTADEQALAYEDLEGLEEIDVDEHAQGESPIPERHQDKFRITARNGYLVGGEGTRGDVMRSESRKVWEGPGHRYCR